MAPPESTSAEAFNQYVSGRLIAVSNLEDNMGALAVQLTVDDLQETNARFRQIAVARERYAPDGMALVQW